MQIDIGAYIAELLYQHHAVNVPALGGFVTHYKPSTVDQVEGKITPPSKSLKFNKNLVLDDGLLINYVRDKHGMSFEQAKKTVADYVDGVLEAIERREIVVFPNVGRLYRDYENNLQFLPDNTNFNTEVYGLPEVEFHPLARTEARKAAQVGKPVRQPSPPVAVQITSWFQRYLAPISALAVVVVALSLYFMFFKPRSGQPVAEDSQKRVPASRYNVSPTDEKEAAAPPAAEADTITAESAAPSVEDEEVSTETEAATVPPERRRYCVIRIGYFADQDNVERLIRRISEAGFEPYSEPSGQLMMVGVQFSYQRSSEIDQTLREVQEKFEPNAKVMRR